MNKNNIVWIAVFITLLLAVGYGIYTVSSQKNNTITESVIPGPDQNSITPPSPTIPEMSTEDVARGFYASYEDCMKNPPKPAAGQVSLYCQSNNPFITSTFVTNLERGGIVKAGADPVVCAQDFPTGFSVGTMTEDGNETHGEVTESFGGVTTVKTTVSLLRESNGWKVDNITCPKP